MKTKSKSIYFKGLSEIRAIAALFVLFHHVELYKYRDGLASLNKTILHDFMKHLGENGVHIFFVLSGFLISYLLLSEKQKTGSIQIKKFYIRRALRIWPLYYFLLIISFLLIPFLANHIPALQNEGYYYSKILQFQKSPYLTVLLFVFFLPNLALKIRPAVVGASQAWSVGVEEQFYFIWPHLFKHTKQELRLVISIGLIIFPPVIVKFISLLKPELAPWAKLVIELFPIHFMAIGALGAYLIFYKKKETETILNNPILFVLNTLLVLVFLFHNVPDVLFGIVVILELLFIIQPNFKFNLRNKYLDKLGEISYGLYMYHPFIMFLCFATVNSVFKIENVLGYNLVIYVLVIGISILVSHLSYTYFERKFIDIKNKRFTIINSGKQEEKE